MADDGRAHGAQHLVLRVEVGLEQRRVRLPGAARARGAVHGQVEVDGHAVHVVHGADEVVPVVLGEQGLDVLLRGGADPLGLEADEDVDLGAVLLPQALGFRVEAIDEQGEGLGARYDPLLRRL